MFGFEPIDLAVIVVYLVGITVIGSWAAKRVKSAASFFIGDRKFGKVMMSFFMFTAATHYDQAVSVTSKVFRSGASGIWYQWMWLFVTPLFWLIAPIFRRMRAVTIGDYFEMRYGPSVSSLYAVSGILQLIVSIGLMLKSCEAMITAATGGRVNPNLAIAAMTVIFVIYSIAGGMNSAVVADFVQGLMTFVFSFLLLPFALDKLGGIAGMRAALPDPAMMEIVAPREITVFYIFMISFNGLVGWVTQPHTMAVCAGGKTEMEGRMGVVSGLFVKRICTIAWMITGLCAVAMYTGQSNIKPDEVFGRMARDLLPNVAPGLVGLFIACILASLMGACGAFMVVSSGLFTQNIYKRFIIRGHSEKHYVIVGRIASVVMVALGVYFAFTIESVVTGLEIFWQVAAMMGIAFWVGLYWRRATVAGAWAGTLASFAVLLFTSRIDLLGWDFNARLAHYLPNFMLLEGNLLLSWQMVMYLLAGFVTTILVSLFTQPVDSARLDRMFECLRTPIAPNEPETKAFTLPAGMQPAPRKVLIDLPGFEIPRPSVVGMAGFAVSWVIVALLIWVALVILKA
jgi:Na+/proline symporter